MDGEKYVWRRLSPEERAKLLEWRKEHSHPWHGPPHFGNKFSTAFHLTAACFEHQDFIGKNPQRLDEFCGDLLRMIVANAAETVAWCVLPNHYHLAVITGNLPKLLRAIGQFHGRTSFKWNAEDDARGRQVFHRSADRAMRSDAHFLATLNYINHNPVHHGYVQNWTDWPWSGATEYLQSIGLEEAERRWREFPIRDYGKGWDEAGM